MSDLKLAQEPEVIEANPFSSAEMYTIQEVCQVMKINRTTYWRRSKAGQMPEALKFKGIGPRIPGSHLRAWFERQHNQGDTDGK